jgi:drug/metabolite transporter (DMT)-like permease
LDPVYEEFSYAEGIALLAAALGAGAMVSGKKLTATDDTLLLMFFSGLTTVLLLGPLFVFDISFFGYVDPIQWEPMSFEDWKYIALIVVCSLTAQYSYIRAYKIGDIGFLAPFEYLKFILSLGIGYLFFAELPETTTYVGALIVMGSTLYLTKKEIKKNPQYNYRPDR